MKVCIYLWFVLSVFVIVSCNYDDSEIRKSVDDLDARVKTLEELCGQMNTNISSLQTLVTALQQNDAITAVTPVLQGSATIGYTITFAKASPITIYHGKEGGSDADGRNAYVPS